jgi:hypothetical protein
MTSIREQHYQPKDLAKLWGFSVETIRKWFEDEPDVLIEDRPERMHKRGYRSMRIPESVAARVYAEHTAGRKAAGSVIPLARSVRARA